MSKNLQGWFDSPIESFRNAYNEAADNWRNAMAMLDAAYNEFQANREYALSDDELAGQYGDLDSRVSLLQSTIQGVESAISTITNFFSSVGQAIGLSGSQTIQGLGVLPAIPWALVTLITAGIAGVWAVINSLREFNTTVANKKIAEQNIINSQNGAPLIPYLDLGPPGGPGGGLLSGVSGTVKWAAIGLLGFMLLSMYKERRT
ncbi:MAG TPA: hypothetical protein VJ577_11390 [Burkholderiaceae bacterium]|nr:hypothetical protein [Burkholderiaceae bacterium]